jgi:hypothetical protein
MKGKLPKSKPTHREVGREGGRDEWWVYGNTFSLGF